MRFEKPSWNKIDRMCEELAKKIKKSGFEPDLIVGIARGGWVPARILSDILNNKSIASIGVVFYKGIGTTARKPELTHKLPVNIKGKRILMVDDVADTGESLVFAKKKLTGAKEVKVATLHMKPWSKFKPDFYINTTDAWLVYPWERRETLRKLKKHAYK